MGFASRRVMELLTQDWSLSAKLRLPAISRLQKVHNVDVAFQVLKSKGADLKDEHGNYIYFFLSEQENRETSVCPPQSEIQLCWFFVSCVIISFPYSSLCSYRAA